MLYLIAASLVWAFSFGLIKHVLVGVGADPFLVAFLRLLLSFLLFLPFARPAKIPVPMTKRLVFIGAIQYGVMYTTYLFAYRFLQAYEIALFTIFTPILVAAWADLLERRFRPGYLLAALLAVVGAGIVAAPREDIGTAVAGFLILQLSNLSFAFGQVAYRRLMADMQPVPGGGGKPDDHEVFALLYLGGLALAVIPVMFGGGFAGLARLSGVQVLTLLYLGLIPSGVCFYLWNRGARRTRTGTLAVMNNAKIPFGVLVALLIFGEEAHWPRLLVGGVILVAAVGLSEWIGRRRAGDGGR